MDNNNLKIGLLVTSYTKYFEVWPDLRETLEGLVKNKIIKNIKKYGEILYPGLVDDIDSAKRVESEFIKKDVDVILIVELAYTTSNIPLAAIKNIKKPIIVLSTQVKDRVKNQLSLKELLSGNCLVGTEELTSALKRTNLNFSIVSGLMDKESTYKELGVYFDAIRVVKKIKNSNIGLMGSIPFPGMMDFMVDETSIYRNFGMSVIHIDTVEIAQVYKSINTKEIDSLKNDLTNKYKKISLSDEQFNNSIRMVASYKKLIEKYNLASVAVYCQPTMQNLDLGIAPCLGTSLLTTEGIPFSCEGDVGTAIALLIMKEITGDSVCAEHYILDYEKNAILLAHEGNGNLNFVRNNGDVEIMPHPMWKGSCGYGAVAKFSYKAGKSTIINIRPDNDDKWKMVISSGETIYFDPIQDLGIPQAWWKINMDLDDFIKRWCSEGPSHHIAFSYGAIEKTLVEIGSLLKLNVSVIK
ncbi:MAG: L-arabinose isomerase family protein [Nitrososphaeraceae archaeon]